MASCDKIAFFSSKNERVLIRNVKLHVIKFEKKIE